MLSQSTFISSLHCVLHAQAPVLRQIAREEGVGALWRGCAPRVLFHVPSAAVCWGIYESAKRILGGQ